MAAKLGRTLIVVLLAWPLPALAWAPLGHEAIAAIAYAHLSPAARAAASSLLGGDAMLVLNASWADEIRDKRPETAVWHYVNIPLTQAAYDPHRDCPDGQCVVGQIERDATILGDAHAAKSARAEALRFLIHFVTDAHQPLHVADNRDHGGNDAIVYLNHRRTNLHHVWDQDVVLAWGSNAGEVARRIDASLSAREIAAGSSGTPADWANESLADAKTIYAQLNGPGLPADYAQRQRALTRDRLAKAGLRLAALLNRILK